MPSELSDLTEWATIVEPVMLDVIQPGTWPDAKNWALFGYETQFGHIYTSATPQDAHRLVTYLNKEGVAQEVRSALLKLQIRRDALTEPNPRVAGGEPHPTWSQHLNKPAAHPKYVTLEKYLRENGLDPDAKYVNPW